MISSLMNTNKYNASFSRSNDPEKYASINASVYIPDDDDESKNDDGILTRNNSVYERGGKRKTIKRKTIKRQNNKKRRKTRKY